MRPRAHWLTRLMALLGAWFMSAMFAALPAQANAQTANFHPCNADPSLPICMHGYGRRIAVKRWGARPEPLDPDAAAKAVLVTDDPGQEARKIKATSVLVKDVDTGEVLFARDESVARPVASLTKLMTALLIVDAGLSMDEQIVITAEDHSPSSELPSRLATGAMLSRADLLHIALASSDNSAAHALGRTYPGGLPAFVAAMNTKAMDLGMSDSRFVEPTGLSNENISTANDLSLLVLHAATHPLIALYSTAANYKVAGQSFNNTNMLLGRPQWDILVSKTGTTREAGDCLLMLIRLQGRRLALVLLNSQGMNGVRFGDAVRLRRVVDSRLTNEAESGPAPIRQASDGL